MCRRSCVGESAAYEGLGDVSTDVEVLVEAEVKAEDEVDAEDVE